MNQEADTAPPIELSSIPKRWIRRVGLAHGMNDTASAAGLPHHGRGDCEDPLLVGRARGSKSRPHRAAGITVIRHRAQRVFHDLVIVEPDRLGRGTPFNGGVSGKSRGSPPGGVGRAQHR